MTRRTQRIRRQSIAALSARLARIDSEIRLIHVQRAGLEVKERGLCAERVELQQRLKAALEPQIPS